MMKIANFCFQIDLKYNIFQDINGLMLITIVLQLSLYFYKIHFL